MKPKRIVVIVSGSRRLHTRRHRLAIGEYLEQFNDYEKHSHVIVLHGAQRGADLMAESKARSLNYETLGVPYFDELDDRKKKEYPGGSTRNRCIIDVACVFKRTGLYRVVMGAFPDAQSTGTWHAVRYAEHKGITPEIIEL